MKETLENKQQPEESAAKKQWIGKGIYGKKDVPIKVLDGLIAGFVVTIIVLVVVFAINGGYYVTFETAGGSEISKQKLRYGDHIEMPEEPVKPGYEFVHWELPKMNIWQKNGILRKIKSKPILRYMLFGNRQQ